MTDEYISDDDPGSDLFDPYETGWWKTTPDDLKDNTDQICPKCDGEGYIVFLIYPWDGYSYDEKPCDLCHRTGYISESEYKSILRPGNG